MQNLPVPFPHDSGHYHCRAKAGRLGLFMIVGFWPIFVAAGFFLAGCGAINPGKFLGIVRTSPDEQYYLLKDVFLTAGSAYSPRDSFDHNVHESVNLFFIPKQEPNRYVAESTWYDPSGLEFRTIRTTHDKKEEGRKGIERQDQGTTRVHSLFTKELFDHKPGLWQVAIHLDGKLCRRLNFSVR